MFKKRTKFRRRKPILSTKVKRKHWYKSKKFKSKVKSTFKNKTVQKGVFTTAAIGTAIAVLPKDLLNRAADVVEKQAGNVFNIADRAGGVLGGLVNFAGTGLDVLSGGLGFLSENFTVVAGVCVGGFVLNKMV